MSQYLIITDLLKRELGDAWKEHILITTSQSKGFLIKIAQREGFDTFYIPDGVGGRFSELCPVGLVAAAVTGIDIRAMIAGAREMDERCKSDDAFAESGAVGCGLDVPGDAEGREHVRDDAVCGFAEADGRLVCAAVGGIAR